MTTNCGLCGRRRPPDNDSPDFCNEQHQDTWYANRQLASTVTAIVRALGRDLTAAFAGLTATLQPLVEAFEQAGVLRKPLPTDVKARALELRRTRNTGPAQHQRAPRVINPRRNR